jgi:CBS domain-containing protein
LEANVSDRKLGWIIRDQDPLVFAETDTVRHACQRMWERRVGAVLVTDGKGRLKGIFTGRDAVRLLGRGVDAAKVTLAACMTPDPQTLAPEHRAIDALRAMQDGCFRHMPVVANGRILGIVSRADFTGLELDHLDDETRIWERIG